MQDTLMEQGFGLMVYGMGTVFVFLTLLVFTTFFMSKIILRLFPEPEPVVVSAKVNANSAAQGIAVNGQTLAVIQAAVQAHRDKTQ